MRIVERSVGFINNPTYENVLMTFNTAARNCYQSETETNNNIESAEKMARSLIKSGHCYNEDAEILTDNGFVKFKDYRGQYKVAVVNADGIFKGFETPLNIISYNYSGKMYDYSSTLGYMTTAGHKMFGKIRATSSSPLTESYKLFKNDDTDYKKHVIYEKTNGERSFCVPTTCTMPKDSNLWGELIGFWVGDGCVNGGNRLTFHLKKDRKIKYITKLATELGIEVEYKRGNKVILKKNNIGNEFTNMYTLNKDKYLPHIDNPIMVKSIIQGLFNADGSNYRGRKSITTTSIYIRDWLVNHASMSGYTIYLGDTTIPKNEKHKPVFRMRIHSNNKILVNDPRKKYSSVKLIDVDKFPVCCVEVSTGIIIVRGTRKIPSLCGNCSTMEHNNIAVKFVMDRSFMGQITRHRLSSFCIESLRYCNMSQDRFGHEVKFVRPLGLEEENFEIWVDSCCRAEDAYFILLKNGCKAETARSVLPLCTATTIVMSANIREWRHIMELRCDSHAQPDMQEIMKKLLDMLYEVYPVFFEDLHSKFKG